MADSDSPAEETARAAVVVKPPQLHRGPSPPTHGARNPDDGAEERIPCRVTVEDIAVHVLLHKNRRDARLCWEEISVVCTRDGVSQRTRWLSAPIGVSSERVQEPSPATGGGGCRGDDGCVTAEKNDRQPSAPSHGTLDRRRNEYSRLEWSPFNNATFVVQFRPVESDDRSMDPDYHRAALAKNLAYLSGVPSAEDVGRRQVHPKVVHPLTLTVQCRNHNKSFAVGGGDGGHHLSTSAGADIAASVYGRGAAMVATLARKVTVGVADASRRRRGAGLPHRPPVDSSANGEGNVRGHMAQSLHSSARGSPSHLPAPDVCQQLLPSGSYVCALGGVDVAEAYNAPGGRRQFSLRLSPYESGTPGDGHGVPYELHFTLVAHVGERTDAQFIPRNYHNFVVLLDQVIVDVTDAMQAQPSAADLPASSAKRSLFSDITGRLSGRPAGSLATHSSSTGTEDASVVSYGFGFTTNVSESRELTHVSACTAVAECGTTGESTGHEDGEDPGGNGVKLVDFSRLHSSHDERTRTSEDYQANPTSVCVVSSECKQVSHARVGNRVISLSRFKTDRDGLCKSSLKCQLYMGLVRCTKSGQRLVEVSNQPVDLAEDVLNMEFDAARIRQVTFSRGEVMFFRLRRRCFPADDRERTDLLLPFDYDNTGVMLPTEEGVQREAVRLALPVSPREAIPRRSATSPVPKSGSVAPRLPELHADVFDTEGPSVAGSLPVVGSASRDGSGDVISAVDPLTRAAPQTASLVPTASGALHPLNTARDVFDDATEYCNYDNKLQMKNLRAEEEAQRAIGGARLESSTAALPHTPSMAHPLGAPHANDPSRTSPVVSNQLATLIHPQPQNMFGSPDRDYSTPNLVGRSADPLQWTATDAVEVGSRVEAVPAVTSTFEASGGPKTWSFAPTESDTAPAARRELAHDDAQPGLVGTSAFVISPMEGASGSDAFEPLWR